MRRDTIDARYRPNGDAVGWPADSSGSDLRVVPLAPRVECTMSCALGQHLVPGRIGATGAH